jgi:succinate dehydrogenase/fumarate reductase flavoprotein subunit
VRRQRSEARLFCSLNEQRRRVASIKLGLVFGMYLVSETKLRMVHGGNRLPQTFCKSIVIFARRSAF